ncbi:PREDICTED: splicing factor 3B subunit 2 [Nicrophorus vespilloides]|uniref:Splicing factor 3B subunit 2 n=1 Tax=Nicrophorus vespilloides TaxID=110193 RepID=A0ABM1MIL1_NICVS|nr:PREDICTED: splicing factor 3B subunit 2 [Nicrophorus vespilloides]
MEDHENREINPPLMMMEPPPFIDTHQLPPPILDMPFQMIPTYPVSQEGYGSENHDLDVSGNDDAEGSEDAENAEGIEVVLPQVLEDVLALKDQRVEELGVEEISSDQQSSEIAQEEQDKTEIEEIVEAIPDNEPLQNSNKSKDPKISRNKKKKKRKKNKRLIAKENEDKEKEEGEEKKKVEEDVEVEYIQETLGLHELAPQYRLFYQIFEAFKISDQKPDIPPPMLAIPTSLSTKTPILAMGDQFQDEMEEGDDKKLEDKSKLSKRKLKKLTRLSVAELKQLVNRPDVVEMHDVTARDPKLLVQLKAHRNTVQVPRHWCFKRKYLQGKRGIEKPPFNLPDFIKRTGIMEMRASLQDKDESKTLKAKMRERARPKLGKIDIDYQKLHDAFFKWQTKPKMTIHGDLYYEGKEFETRLKEKKPGDLSEELRTALGMPVGPNAHKVPPPWLIAMQRYGPQPSYPNLKIPGLNAPIPEGCTFGYHAGGWGKPPVDENGKPLYGDVFGTAINNVDDIGDDATVERNMWGELESESEEESEEEEEQEEQKEPDESGLVTPAEGLVTPSGLSSIPAGMETPETIELRKKKIEAEMEGGDTPALYHVIPEKRNERIGTSMMGSNHVYDMTGVGAPPPAVISARRGAGTAAPPEREGMVELALDPSELDMDSDAMAVRYEQQIRENQSQLQKEDLSDMLAEHVAKQKSKRKRQQNMDTKQTKKYKEFKF